MPSKRVVVAMSGGVDSSVAAAVLKQQGYDVIGMMLRLWSEPGKENSNRCCTPDSMAVARRVAARLGIPFYAVDAQEEFKNTVVRYFIDGYSRGETPNPCMVCNRHIRFGFLLEHALKLGADYLATGHYAQVTGTQEGIFKLLRSVDNHKDQSYILHVLDQQQLSRALFPVGGYTKPEVREMACSFDIQVSARPDSQDLCFLAGEDYRDFLARNAPDILIPGPIKNQDGDEIGVHKGLAFYTIGQRKGLGLSSLWPQYVIQKELSSNTLLVGPSQSMGRSDMIAEEVHWVSGDPPQAEFRAQVKIRYKARQTWAQISPLPNRRIRVLFDEPLRDITPGQAAVIYTGDECLGGGIISQESEVDNQ
ncbi:MAG: tRNA 2-thiouridine(34) synthase MnmA [Anaerolineales bacterium]